MIEKDKTVGVWGYGIVGKSIVNYLYKQKYTVGVMDKRELTVLERQELEEKKIKVYKEEEKNLFCNLYDYFVCSPGVDISDDYATLSEKWKHELDLFYNLFQKPIIAITGSIGKTSLTCIIAHILQLSGKQISIGGNIGIPTFDLLEQQNKIDLALLEVSSFQLHYCQYFAPTLAILTNIYPNHLDRHNTEEEYLHAKNNIFAYQTDNHYSLVPFTLRTKVPSAPKNHKRSYFSLVIPSNEEIKNLHDNESLYFIKDNVVMHYANNATQTLLSLDTITPFSFTSNILIATAVCDILNINPHILYPVATSIKLPAHRLEKVETINNVDFYNDSKGTTTVSTLAAVKQLCHRPLHLFLGGLSKGVDRAPLIAELKNRVNFIYCFGNEAEELHNMCKKNDIPSASFTDLKNAFKSCITKINQYDIVLLSPAGSSYDLYKDYEERGNHFKELVYDFKKSFTMH